ncbi:hypothetical protein NDU88_004639 [Pleurodeles waltl]|uniref:Uncharacterized protein n=1 Tax=Pleurodeles waltl TaxID=8319 RepID=A0AAV7TSJ1_PLEWA|nr:hypothetical protein NDU88_004639 [Pleurodeles waltl]
MDHRIGDEAARDPVCLRCLPWLSAALTSSTGPHQAFRLPEWRFTLSETPQRYPSVPLRPQQACPQLPLPPHNLHVRSGSSD